LVVQTSPANLNDSKKALPLLDAIPSIQGPTGRPRFRPAALLGDRAYGSAANIQGVRARRVESLLARPRTRHGSGLGKWRFVVERTLAWFDNFRRLRLCYEKGGRHFQAFHDLAAAIMRTNQIDHPCAHAQGYGVARRVSGGIRFPLYEIQTAR
jgi:hypothetical protein